MAQIQNDDLFKFWLGPLRTALGLPAQGWPGWPKQMVKPCQHCHTEINKHNVEWHASSKCPRPWFAIECERNLYHTLGMYHVKCGALLGCACRKCVSPPFQGPKARVPYLEFATWVTHFTWKWMKYHRDLELPSLYVDTRFPFQHPEELKSNFHQIDPNCNHRTVRTSFVAMTGMECNYN